MNKFWFVTKSATAALFLVGLSASYAQAEILTVLEDDLGDEAYSQDWLTEAQTLSSCPTAVAAPSADSELSYEFTADPAVEVARDPAIANDIETLPTATEPPELTSEAQDCLAVTDEATLTAADLEADFYAETDDYSTAEVYATAAPALDLDAVSEPVATHTAPVPAPEALEAAPQWEMPATSDHTAPVPQPAAIATPTQPVAIAPTPSTPAIPAPLATETPTTPADTATAAESGLIENDPQFRAWLERDSEAARTVALIQAEELIRGDRSYYDLIAAKNLPSPIAFKLPSTPPPEASANRPAATQPAPATAPAVTALETNVTPLLAQLEADLQRIRAQATQLPATPAAPLLNLRPSGLLPSRSAPAAPFLRFDPQASTATQLPNIFEVPVGAEFQAPLQSRLAFQAPDLSFLKTDAFKRDRHGLRLALFDKPTENEAIANQFLAGNSLFDGTLNAVLANVTAGPLFPRLTTHSPDADWQLLTDSLALLAEPDRSLAALAESGQLDLTADWLDLDAPATLIPFDAPLELEPAPSLELELSLPLEPVPSGSPLELVLQQPLAPARSLEAEF